MIFFIARSTNCTLTNDVIFWNNNCTVSPPGYLWAILEPQLWIWGFKSQASVLIATIKPPAADMKNILGSTEDKKKHFGFPGRIYAAANDMKERLSHTVGVEPARLHQ